VAGTESTSSHSEAWIAAAFTARAADSRSAEEPQGLRSINFFEEVEPANAWSWSVRHVQLRHASSTESLDRSRWFGLDAHIFILIWRVLNNRALYFDPESPNRHSVFIGSGFEFWWHGALRIILILHTLWLYLKQIWESVNTQYPFASNTRWGRASSAIHSIVTAIPLALGAKASSEHESLKSDQEIKLVEPVQALVDYGLPGFEVITHPATMTKLLIQSLTSPSDARHLAVANTLTFIAPSIGRHYRDAQRLGGWLPGIQRRNCWRLLQPNPLRTTQMNFKRRCRKPFMSETSNLNP